jgi:hypothetical protein
VKGSLGSELESETVSHYRIEKKLGTGLPCYPLYERDLLLQPLRDEQKFRNFMARLRSSWEEARVKYAR